MWTLVQWGDDVHACWDILGVVHPIVLGTSLGGMVALVYATQYPAHPGKWILLSTAAAGGTPLEQRVALCARLGVRRWRRSRAAVSSRGTRTPPRSRRGAVWPSLFTRGRHGILRWGSARSAILRSPSGSCGQGEKATRSIASRPWRACSVRPSSLVEDKDPRIPIACQEELVAALQAHLVRFERLPGCGHPVTVDARQHAMEVIRDFMVP